MHLVPSNRLGLRIGQVFLVAGLLLLVSGCLLTKTRRDPLLHEPAEFSCGEQYPAAGR